MNTYGTHQLQLKRDASGPHELHTHIFVISHNYTHYQLPSCIGLHSSSPPLYTQSFILHAHTYAGCDTRHHHLYLHRLATARPSYTHSRLSLF